MALVLTRARWPRALVGAVAMLGMTACGSVPARFSLDAPVLRLDDRRPVPIPRPSDPAGGARPPFVLYPDVPMVDRMSGRHAGDVNALDETVESAFYTPRIARGAVSAEQIGQGPGDGPPELPLAVLEVRQGEGLEFVARDHRGRRYDVRLDPKDRAEVGSSADSIATRLFWAFGFEVAGHDVVFFQNRDLSPVDDALAPAIAAILSRSAVGGDGSYRAGATRMPDGVSLGPFVPRGLRADDPNDRIAHENRRALRALRVLTAWLDLPEITTRQTRDVYYGETGQGFVHHSFAHLHDALGATRPGRPEEDAAIGHYGDFGEVLGNLVTFGARVRPWERSAVAPWPGVGGFESQVFDFSDWRPGFTPIRRSEPEDDYWAAKVLTYFTDEQVRAAVGAARLSTPAAADYVVRTLMERRRKIVQAALARVTPIEVVAVGAGRVVARDLGAATGEPRELEVRFEDASGRELEPPRTVAVGRSDVVLASDHLPGGPAAVRYVRVVVRTTVPADAPRPVELHIAQGADGAPRLVGVLH